MPPPRPRPARFLAALAAAGALAAAAGCSAAGPALLPAHGLVESGPGARERVWARALAAVRERDDEISLGDPVRGVLVTRERERTVPCGAAACPVREVLHLRLDDGRVAVRLDRRLQDAAGAWAPPRDPAAIEAAVAEERAFLARLRAAEVEVRASRAGEGCSGEGDCARGLGCVQRRCVKLRLPR